MVDSLRLFASEVTRVAREVGFDGEARRPRQRRRRQRGMEKPDRLCQHHGRQVDKAITTTAVAQGDLTMKVGIEAAGEIAELREIRS
ncbi:hypothetical protein Pst134EB_020518 [Puccinia striiformis f. sp. tritici]|nr:hypothetical protein Pst134EB_020518 [Puccinia striiformis f. sp. tritici]